MSVKIDQAFIQSFIDGDFGLDIAHENISFDPTGGTEYAELINIPNDITPLSLSGSNQTDGIFRIILRWPPDKGAINAKLKADEVMSAFFLGARICYDGQCATITRANRHKGYAEENWYKTVITIGYRAIIQR